MLRLVGSLVIFFALSACVNLGEKVQGADVKDGDSQNSLIARLGKPTRTEIQGEFTILRYCTTDDAGVRGDALYDFVFAGDALIYQSNYINTKFGLCSSFFRPINWAEVQLSLIHI